MKQTFLNVKKISLYISFSALVSLLFMPEPLCYAQSNDLYFPYMGRVKGKSINVRATASTGSEIMDQVQGGSDIVIIGEEGGWARIKAPNNATAWVYGDLLKDGVITKDNVNIRAGASLSSSAIGKLHEGDTVVILNTFEDWYQIEMPMGMGYYIHKDFIQYLCPLEEYEYFLEKEKKTKSMFREADEFRQTELRKKYYEVNYDGIIDKYQKIMDFYPESLEAEKSLQRIADAKEKKRIAQTRVKSQKLNREIINNFDRAEEERRKIIYADSFDPADYDNVITLYQNIINDHPDSRAAKESLGRIAQLKKQKAQKLKEWDEQKDYTFEGLLKKGTTPATEKAGHKIIGSTGQVLGFVYSDIVDLRAYEGRNVKIQGTRYTFEEDASGKRTPVLKITKISLDQ